MDLAEDNSPGLEAALGPDDVQRLKTQHTHLEEQIGKLEGLRFPTDAACSGFAAPSRALPTPSSRSRRRAPAIV